MAHHAGRGDGRQLANTVRPHFAECDSPHVQAASAVLSSLARKLARTAASSAVRPAILPRSSDFATLLISSSNQPSR
jgi:hypothetical protein